MTRRISLVIGHWPLAIGLLCLAALPARAAEPLTLDDAIRLALERNKAVKVQAFSRDIGRVGVLTAYGRFDPALTFRGTVAESDNPVSSNPLAISPTKTDDYSLTLDGLMPWGMTYSVGATANNSRGAFNSFADSYSTFGGVTLTQPLLRGFGLGPNLAGLRLAKADRAISEWDYRQTVIDTVTRVINAYNDVLLARENLRVADYSRTLAQQLLDENEQRLKVGSIASADVTQARARVAGRSESVLYSERAVRDAENRLRLLLGEDRFAVNGPALDLAPLPPAPETAIAPADDLPKALNLRPDFQAARLGLKKSEINDTVARNQLLPRVDLVGSYGYAGLDRDFAAARAQVRAEQNRAYTAGVVVSVPLSLAEGRGKARAARLAARQADADLKRLEADIALAVANAAGQIETARKRVAATQTAYELARQALDAEVKRLRAGTSSTFFVLQLQENLVEIESRQAAAQVDVRRALAAYDRELGTTLERHKITLE